MTASNPLDAALLEDEEGDGGEVSKEETLNRYMAGLGFQPKKARAQDTLEFYRSFVDPSGKVGRVVAVIKRDEVGLDPKEVDYFAVTVQTHLRATDEEVKARAPAFCKADLLRVLAHFDPKNERREADVVECGYCGMFVAEYEERDGKHACHDCAKRKGLT